MTLQKGLLLVPMSRDVKMEAIYLHVLKRNQIFLAGEVLQFNSVSQGEKITVDTGVLSSMTSLK